MSMPRRNPFLNLCALAFLGFFFVPGAFSQSTYYIDYVNGSNSNPGAKAQPWKTHPRMASGLDTGAACVATPPRYSHVAGDRFYFKGGVVWPAACFAMVVDGYGGLSSLVRDYYGIEKDPNGVITWYDPASREPGCASPHLVTKDRDAAGNLWGKTLTLRTSCQPVFDAGHAVVPQGTNDGDRGFMVWIRYSYIEFDNFEMRYRLVPGRHTGATFLNIADSDGVLVHHLYLHGAETLVVPITTISRTANVVTVVTSVPHQLYTGDGIVIESTGTALDGYCTETSGPACAITVGNTTQIHFTKTGTDVAAVHVGNVISQMNSTFMISTGSSPNLTVDSIDVDNSEYNVTRNGTSGVWAVRNLTNSVIHDVETLVLGGGDAVGNVLYNACWCPAAGNCLSYDPTQHTNGFYQIYGGTIANNLIYNFGCNAAIFYPNPEADSSFCPGGAGHGNTVNIYNNVAKVGQGPSQIYMFDINPMNYGGDADCDTVNVWNNTVENTADYMLRVTPGRAKITNLVIRNNHFITPSGIQIGPGCGASVVNCTLDHNLSQTIAAANSQGYTDANSFAPMLESSSTVGAGVNLSTSNIVRLKNGRPPLPAPWDIGAYQYGPSPPSGLTIAVR